MSNPTSNGSGRDRNDEGRCPVARESVGKALFHQKLYDLKIVTTFPIMSDSLAPLARSFSLKAIRDARETAEKHLYFSGVANARYVLRKVFRIIEEHAKEHGLDAIHHQSLIQIYGSQDGRLRVKELAARMDISQAFASSVSSTLIAKGYAERIPCEDDLRSNFIGITSNGVKLLCTIDDAVRVHVEYFTKQLSDSEREMVIYMMMFYIGL
ncbi:MarR family winged helix-turn-helix transcriptional regulator [Paraburkholderia lycopersici]|uniref:DNA-binding transcriptional regulator, MarR family n=1 Tax=Paraburkholderia lycopersici TaxID=416944 RepID=A0A1G6W4W2_9BURK|nr:MarR family winged helix-turn-helix transcriptional regulator [Paraburkholderia lycopersici]SDD60743.1 DNA-binding transcriptional regulator, MarR family [Paraburkholderia lycopersici]